MSETLKTLNVDVPKIIILHDSSFRKEVHTNFQFGEAIFSEEVGEIIHDSLITSSRTLLATLNFDLGHPYNSIELTNFVYKGENKKEISLRTPIELNLPFVSSRRKQDVFPSRSSACDSAGCVQRTTCGRKARRRHSGRTSFGRRPILLEISSE